MMQIIMHILCIMPIIVMMHTNAYYYSYCYDAYDYALNWCVIHISVMNHTDTYSYCCYDAYSSAHYCC